MAMANPNRVNEDFDPPSDLVSEQGCDTVLVYLPGFRKEQLKVQLTTSRILKVSGERPVGDNKWRRFHKEFRITPNCETREITAKFEGGILYIRQPKLITPAAPPEQQPQAPIDLREEEKAERGEKVAMASNNGDERKEKCELSGDQRVKQVVAGSGSGLFKELRKPGNFKRLAVSVLMVAIVFIYISQLFKSLTRKQQKTVMEYAS